MTVDRAERLDRQAVEPGSTPIRVVTKAAYSLVDVAFRPWLVAGRIYPFGRPRREFHEELLAEASDLMVVRLPLQA